MGEKNTSTCQSSSSVSRRKNQRARSPTTYPHGSGRRQTHKRSKCPDSSSGKEERAPVGRRTGLFSKTESSSPSKLSTTKLPQTPGLFLAGVPSHPPGSREHRLLLGERQPS